MSEKLIPGMVALLGSGETSPAGGQVFERVAREQPVPLSVSVLETPAGFELNSPLVAGRVADYLKVRLQNYRPDIRLVPARRRESAFSPDDPQILAPLLHSDLIYLGAGSPSYAVRQLSGSLAWDLVQARHRHGAALVLASAAAISAGRLALPVYEIFKVGEDVHWKAGLDLLAPFGLNLVIVSHWNNAEGGADLDTSRCFIGQARFAALQEMLPPELTLVGLDEGTGLVLDFEHELAHVIGRDQVHVLHAGQERVFSRGDSFPLQVLGNYSLPDNLAEGIGRNAWASASEIHQREQQPLEIAVPGEVRALLELRQAARANRAWAEADAIRHTIAGLGWRVVDTPQGQKVEPFESGE